MSGELMEQSGHVVLVLDRDGSMIEREADAGDALGLAFAAGADWIAIPLERVSPDFLDLKTRQMGLFLQKIVNYHRKVAFVGDVSEPMATSKALNDFVYESNRGNQVWFVDDIEALSARLSLRAN